MKIKKSISLVVLTILCTTCSVVAGAEERPSTESRGNILKWFRSLIGSNTTQETSKQDSKTIFIKGDEPIFDDATLNAFFSEYVTKKVVRWLARSPQAREAVESGVPKKLHYESKDSLDVKKQDLVDVIITGAIQPSAENCEIKITGISSDWSQTKFKEGARVSVGSWYHKPTVESTAFSVKDSFTQCHGHYSTAENKEKNPNVLDFNCTTTIPREKLLAALKWVEETSHKAQK